MSLIVKHFRLQHLNIVTSNVLKTLFSCANMYEQNKNNT